MVIKVPEKPTPRKGATAQVNHVPRGGTILFEASFTFCFFLNFVQIMAVK
jgi:hypothetical protein